MKNHLATKILISLAIVLIGFGIFIEIPKAKAEVPTIDPEKTFLLTFAPVGIQSYRFIDFTKYGQFLTNRYTVLAGMESNGNWTIISIIQPQSTPTPTP